MAEKSNPEPELRDAFRLSQEAYREKDLVDKYGQQIIVVQLSTPRTSSNITAIALGQAADAVARSLAMDADTGVSFTGHAVSTMNAIEAPKGDKPTAYFKEHGACLTANQLDELYSFSNKFLAIQRDPFLILESMLNKLLLTDKTTGKESRVNFRIRQILADPAQSGNLYDRFGVEESLKNKMEACISASDVDSAAAIFLDSCANQKGFDTWEAMQERMKATRDYSLANDILQLTHPDRGTLVTDEEYSKPQQFFTRDPFSFIRQCAETVTRFIEKYGTEKLSIIDATAVRASHEELLRAARAVGLDPELVSTEWAVHESAATKARTDTAEIFIGRAMRSTSMDLPSEYPLSPSQVPDFLKKEGGLLWQLIESYTRCAFSRGYIGPRTEAEVASMLNTTVAYEYGREIKLAERNPLFAYVAVISSNKIGSKTKQQVAEQMRNILPDYSGVFDYADRAAAHAKRSLAFVKTVRLTWPHRAAPRQAGLH